MVIIGKSIETLPCRPARRIARIWVTNSLEFSKKIRVDRQPMNGIGLAATAEVGNGLVAAEVERADRHGLVGRVRDDLAVVLVLLLLVRARRDG